MYSDMGEGDDWPDILDRVLWLLIVGAGKSRQAQQHET